MATQNNENYFYMRLKEGFYTSDEIILLEAMPDGYLYSNILLKLYLKSLKNGGRLVFNNYIPYNPTMLAEITRHPVGVVEKALDAFKAFGLIEILDNGTIYMLNIQEFIGKTSTEADRKRRYRKKIEEEKALLLADGQMSGQSEDKTATKTETELETDTELKIEKELHTDIDVTELNARQKDRVDFLRELFVEWNFNDYQIFHLSSLVNKRLPYDLSTSLDQQDLRIYDVLQEIVYLAKATPDIRYPFKWFCGVIEKYKGLE